MTFKQLFLAVAIASLTTAPVAQADTGIGGGISYVFGQGLAVGVKLLTTDKKDKTIASVGLDYMLGTGTWRPNVGLGYLGDKVYGDLNTGYNYQNGTWDFGMSAGVADSEDK